jgi:carbohydrate-selective porin OprB
VYGGYVNASLIYHLEENGDLYLGVQYMSLGKANISGGGRQGQLNLGGQVYITAGINWPF